MDKSGKSNKMKEVFNVEQFEMILQEAGDRLVVVDFKASWCGPCKVIQPAITKLTQDEAYKDVIFCIVDVDEASELAEKYEVEVMPAFMFFKNGEKIRQLLGANKDKIKSFIDQEK